MTTPANRAPRFVVVDRDGCFGGLYETGSEAGECASRFDKCFAKNAPHTVHPIGAALPVAEPVKKTMGQVLYESDGSTSWQHARQAVRDQYERDAQAVIAAHEAGKGWEVTVRYAVTRRDCWWNGNFFTLPKEGRHLFDSAEEARERVSDDPNWCRIVRITTRRRRVRP